MPNHSLRRSRIHRLASLGLFALALPCIYFGSAGAAFYYRLHAVSGAATVNRLPLAPTPQSATRLLVFAPHCDDETLGCAGLIQQTLAAGGTVRVVMLTNGDGFRAAVQREMRDLRVEPQDYIRFAALRQEESCRALEHLGVRSENVLFLGYPDRGLMNLWNTNWTPDKPYLSAYTRCDHSPYPRTFHPNARYCGQELLGDVEVVLRDFRPTRVTVTHPSDDHPDHAAAAAFVTRAMQALRSNPTETAWAEHARLEYYLVHRGDWPLPQGSHVGHPLPPPTAMVHLDTHWTKLPMTAAETTRKAQSIALYPSQTALAERFLTSFARQNELLGELTSPRLTVVPDNSQRVDARAEGWEQVTPVLLNPAGDNVLRDLQGGGNITALYACRDSRTLYLRLDTRAAISPRVRFTLRLRTFEQNGDCDPQVYTLRFTAADAHHGRSDGVSVAVKGRTLEAAIPWNYLARSPKYGPTRALALSADTDLAGVEIDKTGIRFLTL